MLLGHSIAKFFEIQIKTDDHPYSPEITLKDRGFVPGHNTPFHFANGRKVFVVDSCQFPVTINEDRSVSEQPFFIQQKRAEGNITAVLFAFFTNKANDSVVSSLNIFFLRFETKTTGNIEKFR